MAKGAGRSLYRGIRITYTEEPGGEFGWITISAKHTSGGWDEWNAVAPATRVSLPARPSDVAAAVLMVSEAVETVLSRIAAL